MILINLIWDNQQKIQYRHILKYFKKWTSGLIPNQHLSIFLRNHYVFIGPRGTTITHQQNRTLNISMDFLINFQTIRVQQFFDTMRKHISLKLVYRIKNSNVDVRCRHSKASQFWFTSTQSPELYSQKPRSTGEKYSVIQRLSTSLIEFWGDSSKFNLNKVLNAFFWILKTLLHLTSAQTPQRLIP